ncbi:hypothetical protein B484DRAFT_4679, partial [Ochromonadaceae sp. CCMP2298]
MFEEEVDMMGRGLTDLSALHLLTLSQSQVGQGQGQGQGQGMGQGQGQTQGQRRALDRVHSLNLHFNQLTSLHGLPRYTFLSSLNLSSNHLVSCDLPELALLPALSTLDLSGNKISSLRLLPFLPSLTTLAAAFNFITSCAGLADATPALESLDLRGNLISHMPGNDMRNDMRGNGGGNGGLSCGLKDLSSLQALANLRLGGSKPNPVMGVAGAVEGLFHVCLSLQSVDG